MDVGLLIITNGRKEYIQQTISSLEENINCLFHRKVIVDDSMDRHYQQWLINTYPDYEVHPNKEKGGLSGSIINGWNQLSSESDFVFHLEEDFIFNQNIDIEVMQSILIEQPNLSQVALVRQPLNDAEISSGGVLKQYEGKLVNHIINIEDLIYNWVEHKILFTLNPCLYPKWVMQSGWRAGWGEREFTDYLLDMNCTFGYLGNIHSRPHVHHIGEYRAAGWSL